MTMKQFTSASAGKYIKSLEDRKSHILGAERRDKTYRCSANEEPEAPAYDYRATRDEVAAIDAEVLAVRHALHLFNNSAVLPTCGLTIDEALIKLAMMNKELAILGQMRGVPAKSRLSASRWDSSGCVEYEYANFDPAEAERDYLAVSARIAELQLEIDLANQTSTFEVDV